MTHLPPFEHEGVWRAFEDYLAKCKRLGETPSEEGWHTFADYRASRTLHGVVDLLEDGRTHLEATDRAVYILEFGRFPSFLEGTRSHDRLAQLKDMAYPDYLQTPEWIATRNSARERADRRCVVCNSAERLEIHHRTYRNKGQEEVRDVICLCADCHELFHTNRKLVRA